MTRYALKARKGGRYRQFGTTDDLEAAERFRVRLEAGLGVPVNVIEIPDNHPEDCLNCRCEKTQDGTP